MNENIVLTIVELVISIMIEGIILAMVFQWISNKSTEKQEQNLKQEMQNLEKQNRKDYESIMNAIQLAKSEIISQVKESSKEGEK